jgi:hypothetical protein
VVKLRFAKHWRWSILISGYICSSAGIYIWFLPLLPPLRFASAPFAEIYIWLIPMPLRCYLRWDLHVFLPLVFRRWDSIAHLTLGPNGVAPLRTIWAFLKGYFWVRIWVLESCNFS